MCVCVRACVFVCVCVHVCDSTRYMYMYICRVGKREERVEGSRRKEKELTRECSRNWKSLLGRMETSSPICSVCSRAIIYWVTSCVQCMYMYMYLYIVLL